MKPEIEEKLDAYADYICSMINDGYCHDGLESCEGVELVAAIEKLEAENEKLKADLEAAKSNFRAARKIIAVPSPKDRKALEVGRLVLRLPKLLEAFATKSGDTKDDIGLRYRYGAKEWRVLYRDGYTDVIIKSRGTALAALRAVFQKDEK